MFDLLAPSFLFHLILACIVAKRTETCKMLMKQKKSFDSLILMWIAKSFLFFSFCSLNSSDRTKDRDRVKGNYTFITSKLSNKLINFRALKRVFNLREKKKRNIQMKTEWTAKATATHDTIIANGGFCSNILD